MLNNFDKLSKITAKLLTKLVVTKIGANLSKHREGKGVSLDINLLERTSTFIYHYKFCRTMRSPSI